MTAGRPHSYEVENENLDPSRPPRPKTEPRNAQSSDTVKTPTDPATGEPKRTAPKPN